MVMLWVLLGVDLQCCKEMVWPSYQRHLCQYKCHTLQNTLPWYIHFFLEADIGFKQWHQYLYSMNPFLSLSVARWDLKCHSFLFVKCLQLEARAQKRVPRLYSLKISWTLCKIVNWQWHLMSKTNIHLLHTHTGVNLHCHASLPPVPNVILKYQKAKCTKISWNIESCGNSAFDTWSNLPLPKFAQISKVKFIQLLMRQYLRPGCKSKRDWKFRRVRQATGSNLWIAWVSPRQRLLLIIKVFSLYDNSTRLNITSTMLP